jgi:CO/xanthine dehydrogenase FAD-binding subunit
MRPQGLAIAQLNMAVWVHLAEDGSIERARLAVGPSGPVPRRAARAEEALRGMHFEPAGLDRVLPVLLSDLQLRTSPHRATVDYRRQLACVLLRRVVPEAIRSAGKARPAIQGAQA